MSIAPVRLPALLLRGTLPPLLPGPTSLEGQGQRARALAAARYGGLDPPCSRCCAGGPADAVRSAKALLRRSRHNRCRAGPRIRREVEAVGLPVAAGADDDDRHGDTATATARVVDQLRPASVLELRTTTAGTAISAARNGARGIASVAADADANRAFAMARAKDVWVLPLVLDFTKPTPAIGFFDHFSIAAVDRLRSELVVAGDAVRYAVSTDLSRSRHIRRALAAFSSRYALAALAEASSLPSYVLEPRSRYCAPAFLRTFARVRRSPPPCRTNGWSAPSFCSAVAVAVARRLAFGELVVPRKATDRDSSTSYCRARRQTRRAEASREGPAPRARADCGRERGRVTVLDEEPGATVVHESGIPPTRAPRPASRFANASRIASGDVRTRRVHDDVRRPVGVRDRRSSIVSGMTRMFSRDSSRAGPTKTQMRFRSRRSHRLLDHPAALERVPEPEVGRKRRIGR